MRRPWTYTCAAYVRISEQISGMDLICKIGLPFIFSSIDRVTKLIFRICYVWNVMVKYGSVSASQDSKLVTLSPTLQQSNVKCMRNCSVVARICLICENTLYHLAYYAFFFLLRNVIDAFRVIKHRIQTEKTCSEWRGHFLSKQQAIPFFIQLLINFVSWCLKQTKLIVSYNCCCTILPGVA